MDNTLYISPTNVHSRRSFFNKAAGKPGEAGALPAGTGAFPPPFLPVPGRVAKAPAAVYNKPSRQEAGRAG